MTGKSVMVWAGATLIAGGTAAYSFQGGIIPPIVVGVIGTMIATLCGLALIGELARPGTKGQ